MQLDPCCVSGSVFSKKINSYVRMFVNMADFYVAANIRKFVFSKALRIFAATNFVSYVRKSREGLFALQRAQPQISWMFYRLRFWSHVLAVNEKRTTRIIIQGKLVISQCRYDE